MSGSAVSPLWLTKDRCLWTRAEFSARAELSDDVLAGYEAPYPQEKYKAGAKTLPSLVPISTDDPEHEANKKAIERFRN